MIQGFPFQSSVFPGDTLTFCVGTDAPQFRVDLSITAYTGKKKGGSHGDL